MLRPLNLALIFLVLLGCAAPLTASPAKPKPTAKVAPLRFGSAAPRRLVLTPADGPLAGKTIYKNSFALLVGVNNYPQLPSELSLHYAVADVQSLRTMLVQYYGFPPENVVMLTNEQATKQNIENALTDLTDDNKVGPEDRILIYFSGHGQTVSSPLGGDLGFLIPSDAKVDLAKPENIGPYNRSCLSMSWMRDTLQSCPAKHVLFLADACYSGLLVQSRSLEPINKTLLPILAAKRARQVITAGGKGETSAEMTEYGHGAFTYKLIEELKARAITPDAAFAASDLYTSLKTSVTNLTAGKQIPQLGSYNTEGDFFFITTPKQPLTPVIDVVVTPPPHPSGAMTLANLLQRHMDAMGGRAALEAIRSIETQGTLLASANGISLKGAIIHDWEYPDKSATLTGLIGPRGTNLSYTGFDGKHAWKKSVTVAGTIQDAKAAMPDAPALLQTQEERETEISDVYMDSFSYLLSGRMKGTQTLRSVRDPGTGEYLVDVYPDGGKQVTLYINPTTYLIHLIKETAEGKVRTELFSNYQKRDNVMFPIGQGLTLPGTAVIAGVITSVKTNLSFSPDPFTYPGSE